MLRLVIFSLCATVCLSATYTGTYYTISSDLRALFGNDHAAGRVQWTSDTRLEGNGYPHYTVNCAGNPNWASSTNENILDIPTEQTIGATSYCLPMGATGFALNGVPFFNAASADDEDAFTAEGQTFDGCGAHSEHRGNYHYHIVPGSTSPKLQGNPDCFPQVKVPGWTSDLGTTYFQGVALDGFPVFVTINNEQVVQENDLDECGGKPYTTDRYAYFISPIFPYTFGCFKGEVKYTNSPPANMAKGQQCNYGGSGQSGYLCYCHPATGMSETDCLPSKGQRQEDCVIGAASNWQLSGQCLNVKPTDYVGSSSDGTNTGNGGGWGPMQPGGGMGPMQPGGGWGPMQPGGGMGPMQPGGGWGPMQPGGGMGPGGGWGRPGGGMGPMQPGGGMGPMQPGGGWGSMQPGGGMRPPMGGRGGRGGRRGGRGGRHVGRGGRRPGGYSRSALTDLWFSY